METSSTSCTECGAVIPSDRGLCPLAAYWGIASIAAYDVGPSLSENSVQLTSEFCFCEWPASRRANEEDPRTRMMRSPDLPE